MDLQRANQRGGFDDDKHQNGYRSDVSSIVHDVLLFQSDFRVRFEFGFEFKAIVFLRVFESKFGFRGLGGRGGGLVWLKKYFRFFD